MIYDFFLHKIWKNFGLEFQEFRGREFRKKPVGCTEIGSIVIERMNLSHLEIVLISNPFNFKIKIFEIFREKFETGLECYSPLQVTLNFPTIVIGHTQTDCLILKYGDRISKVKNSPKINSNFSLKKSNEVTMESNYSEQSSFEYFLKQISIQPGQVYPCAYHKIEEIGNFEKNQKISLRASTGANYEFRIQPEPKIADSQPLWEESEEYNLSQIDKDKSQNFPSKKIEGKLKFNFSDFQEDDDNPERSQIPLDKLQSGVDELQERSYKVHIELSDSKNLNFDSQGKNENSNSNFVEEKDQNDPMIAPFPDFANSIHLNDSEIEQVAQNENQQKEKVEKKSFRETRFMSFSSEKGYEIIDTNEDKIQAVNKLVSDEKEANPLHSTPLEPSSRTTLNFNREEKEMNRVGESGKKTIIIVQKQRRKMKGKKLKKLARPKRPMDLRR